MLVAICWATWKARNNLCFNAKLIHHPFEIVCRLRFFNFLGRFAQRGGLVPNQGGRLDAAIAGLPDAGQLESFDTKDDPSPPPTDQGSSDDVASGDEGP